MEILNEDNFILYAMKHYVNPQCLSINEFHSDLKRLKYIRRLFNRYLRSGVMKERLILNHLIVLYNVFGPEATTKILFYSFEERFWPPLKTFLIYLSYMPEKIHHARSQPILSTDIPLDPIIITILRSL